jgi:hypothetical protein
VPVPLNHPMKKPSPVSSYVLSYGLRVRNWSGNSGPAEPFARPEAPSSMLRRPALCSFPIIGHRLRAGTVSVTSKRCLTTLSEHLKLEVAFTATSKVCRRLQLAACSLCLHACSSPTVPDHPPKPATARGCAPPRTQYHVVGWACHLHSRNTACASRCLAIAPPEPASLSLAAMAGAMAGTVVQSAPKPPKTRRLSHAYTANDEAPYSGCAGLRHARLCSVASRVARCAVKPPTI